ncbi:hypothetical protein [Sulfobacillus sp. hq2]|uniref:hypothetical protein n=1 Tax=Sulfobacillus TaxID=28033 RepID=UPI000CD011AD|nr:hypothetical protein [Sulfobacillus sp. hq2]POB12345.1 hypothetical protein CO251_00030 [Sulfobacillus sp. hq2]
MAQRRTTPRRRGALPGRRRVEWTRHAMIRWRERFPTLGVEDAWDYAVFWGHYRGLWAWRVCSDGVAIAIPTPTAWRILTYWRLAWWDALVTQHNEWRGNHVVGPPEERAKLLHRREARMFLAARQEMVQ